MSPSEEQSQIKVADVRHPGTRKKNKYKKQFKLSPKKFVVLSLIISLLLLTGFFALDIKGSATAVYRGFQDLAYQAKNFSIFGLGDTLSGIEGELDELDSKARFLSLAPSLEGIPAIIKDLKLVVDTVKEIAVDLNIISSDGVSLAFSGGGEQLIEALRRMEENVINLAALGDGLEKKAVEFGVEDNDLDFIGDDILEFSTMLSTLVDFIDQEEPINLVLLFENPSELRPGGGFAGSYGELILDKGSVSALNVQDIYYPDKFLGLDIEPPLQLQGITPDWGARDTLWFFDFRQSAPKLMSLLEASDIYEDDLEFDGVIALNVRTVENLLRLTGPIEVEEYDMTLNYRNFLSEIQKEVEESNVPGENPKKVLQFAAPRLIEALGSIDDSKKDDLIEVFTHGVANKDIKFFFEDQDMQSLVEGFDAAGATYELGEDFVGDYLALVNTNVAGGKTDVLVDQRVVLRSEISEQGVLRNELEVTRNNRGNLYIEPWYNHKNQNFFKVFSVPEASLINLSGGQEKEIIPLIDYATAGYEVDEDIKALEDTREILEIEGSDYAESYIESGKKVFATWFNIDPGESKVLRVNYESGTIPLRSGQRFTFVLDKQSGSEMELEYLLAAPEGYIFQENGSSLFQQRWDSVPNRLKVDLTLRKI